jgi:riboflavin synthase
MLGREAGDGTFKPGCALVLLERFARVALIGGLGHAAGILVLGSGIEKGNEPAEPATPPAKFVNRAADCNRVHPGAELRVAAKFREAAPRGQPHFLADIPRRVFLPDDGDNEPEDRFVVRLHQFAKRFLLPGPGALEQSALGVGRERFRDIGHGEEGHSLSAPVSSKNVRRGRVAGVVWWFAAWRNAVSRFARRHMFTGIVEEAGEVLAFTAEAGAWSLRVAARVVLGDLSLGDSIAVNGCCLTVAEFDARSMRFDVLEETRRRTNFPALQPGSKVNLERSLRFGGKVSGHFVTGHIDTVGVIETFEPRGKDQFLEVRVPAGLTRFIVHKGSIAIDGISLTIADVSDDRFAVWLIPHTLAVTNLGGRRAGDQVNLEFDLLGKNVERLLQTRTS